MMDEDMNKEEQINPFGKDSVSGFPRNIEKPVPGLNDEPLESLLWQFEKLEKNSLPRKDMLDKAQFVMSLAAGFGKSHLIGRLFDKLRGRATLVYLSPFEDASTCWKTILLKMVQELKFPDTEDAGNEGPTQIEAFAHGILIHLTVNAIENGAISSDIKRSMIQALQKITVEELKNQEKWLDWIRSNFNGLIQQFVQQLQRRGINLNASPLSWLRVLFTYTYFPSDIELRETCMDWLQGGCIDSDDAKRIGIRLKDIPNADISISVFNETCKHRILDFCKLAGFFRPFVFCFDQIENYGKDVTLVKAMGSVIQVLVDEIHNQMTVVTANYPLWSEQIKPFLEPAYQDRLSLPLELEGLNKHQAMELIVQRLKCWRLENEKDCFIGDGNWLNELFIVELGIRDFLKLCSGRWKELKGQSSKQLTIAEYYKKSVEEVKTQPNHLVFDPSTLYWLARKVAEGLPDISVEEYKSQKGYFTLLWKSEDRQIFFGFESGSNSSRWQAIVREAEIHYSANNETKIVFFRTSELPEIPAQKWKKIGPVIEKAEQQYLHIIRLKKSEMPVLYAARTLYVDAKEGNIRFQPQEVLEFIRGQLKSFWERIRQPLPLDSGGIIIVPPPDGEELIQEIREIVERNKFMSVDDVMKKLSAPVSEELLHEARAHIPEIKVHVGPNMTVLLWQSDQSM